MIAIVDLCKSTENVQNLRPVKCYCDKINVNLLFEHFNIESGRVEVEYLISKVVNF